MKNGLICGKNILTYLKLRGMIKLRKKSFTPPPPKPTSATKIPMFLSNHERIQSIIQSFVNRTLNKEAEEREETPNASGLTKQQEMIYATE